MGRFQARVEGTVTGNVLLRRAQCRASEAAAEVVRSIVIGKVANQRAVPKRSLRIDPINALLSFLNTLLTHDCRSACEGVGLDPAVGFLHRDRPGRPSLVLDLTEEWRAPLADRLALSLVNRRQLRAVDFCLMDGGAVLLTDDARKAVLTAWQERKRAERHHPFLGEKASFGLVPWLQAQMLARHLRGDLDAYPPWFWT